jgi:hypothetical protein
MQILTHAFYEALEKVVGESLGPIEDRKTAEAIERLIPKIIPDIAKPIKDTLLKESQKMLEERRKLFLEFCQRNNKRWRPAFDLLETFIVICTEAGDNFNKSYRPKAVKEKDIVFDIVVRHHARACHIAQEIMCLLKSGFPDGAHARWRALHEVTVTALFVEKHGRECAERFYWHDVVESYRGMAQHRKYEHRLQEKGPTDEEIEKCKVIYDRLIDKYGQSFGEHYGWACHIFAGKKKKVTFADLEQDVSLDHMRPYYKWASQNIHAGAKGINNKLGLCEATEDILLVGQSNSGMTDPAHAAAISLAQITTVLLTIEPNIDMLVILHIVSEMAEEIGETFLQCDKGVNS